MYNIVIWWRPATFLSIKIKYGGHICKYRYVLAELLYNIGQSDVFSDC